MKLFEVNITKIMHEEATVYVAAEDWEDAKEIARETYYYGEYDDKFKETYTHNVTFDAFEVDEDPECYED